MNEAELLRRVEKRRTIPDRSWAYLRDKGYVDEALDRNLDDEAVDYIIDSFDELAAASPGTLNRRQTPDRERDAVLVSLSESELQRKAAFEEYAAKCAACDDHTRRFRDEVLQNRLLTAEQARRLLRSPAAQFFEASAFEFRGGAIPLLDHRGTLVHYERRKGKGKEGLHRATVLADPPGILKTVKKPPHELSQVVIRGPGRTDLGGGHALHYVNERGRARRVPVWGGSPLAWLRGLSEELAQRYRWEPAQSTIFVLTGEIPAVLALKVTKSFQLSRQVLGDGAWTAEYLDATIDVKAAAWVPSRTVARAYRKAQIEVLGSSGGKPPGLKNLELFRFVTKRMPAGFEVMPEGNKLVSEWNEVHPQWAYKNTRQFWRDYRRIERTIAVGPPYKMDRAATEGPGE